MTDQSEAKRLFDVAWTELTLLLPPSGEPKGSPGPLERAEGKPATNPRPLRAVFEVGQVTLMGDTSDEPWLQDQFDRKGPRRFLCRSFPGGLRDTRGGLLYNVFEFTPGTDTEAGDIMVFNAKPIDAKHDDVSGLECVVFGCEKWIELKPATEP